MYAFCFSDSTCSVRSQSARTNRTWIHWCMDQLKVTQYGVGVQEQPIHYQVGQECYTSNRRGNKHKRAKHTGQSTHIHTLMIAVIIPRVNITLCGTGNCTDTVPFDSTAKGKETLKYHWIMHTATTYCEALSASKWNPSFQQIRHHCLGPGPAYDDPIAEYVLHLL